MRRRDGFRLCRAPSTDFGNFRLLAVLQTRGNKLGQHGLTTFVPAPLKTAQARAIRSEAWEAASKAHKASWHASCKGWGPYSFLAFPLTGTAAISADHVSALSATDNNGPCTLLRRMDGKPLGVRSVLTGSQSQC